MTTDNQPDGDEDAINPAFGTILKRLRKHADLTMADAAKEIGVSAATYRSWERGQAVPDAGQQSALEWLLDVSVAWMLRYQPVGPDVPVVIDQTSLEPWGMTATHASALLDTRTGGDVWFVATVVVDADQKAPNTMLPMEVTIRGEADAMLGHGVHHAMYATAWSGVPLTHIVDLHVERLRKGVPTRVEFRIAQRPEPAGL